MEKRAGRATKLMGTLLLVMGGLTMIGALVTPAAADPGNGHAYGHYKDDRSVVTIPDPAPGSDTVVTDPQTGAPVDCGDYCPNGVGLPSGNGNGGGNATGEPCAGCVGNADGKNPPGQFKNGGDPNNGYECDGNNGIAKTNPAHTGCQSPSTTVTVPNTTTTTEAPCTGAACGTTTTTAPSTTTTTEAPCTGAACSTTTTVAESTTTTAGATVLGENFTRPNDPGAAANAASGPLAFTGTTIGKAFFAGLALVLMGIVVMAHRSRGVLAKND